MDRLEPDVVADGHKMFFTLDKDEIRLSRVSCPNEGLVGHLCNRRRTYCVVDKFLQVYGLQCNVGLTDLEGPVEIAWIGVPGVCDLDPEYEQIWVIPVDDEKYRSLKSDTISM